MSWDGREKRYFVRANFPCKIIIHTPKEHSIISNTENIGAGGVRVIIGENLEISSQVGLELFLGGVQIVCEGRIVWVVKKPDFDKSDAETWDTGIEFYEISERDRKMVDGFVKTVISGQK